MKKYIYIALLFTFSFSLQAYSQDSKAKGILTKLGDKTKNAKTITAEFKSTLSNKAESIEESRKGKLLSAGDKYHIYLDDMEVITDGKLVWTILSDAEEVQVNVVPEEGDMADFSNPTKIATLWEKGFKYEYKNEESINGAKVHLIQLYPENPDERDFHTLKLYIDQLNHTLKKIVVKGKTGTDIIYEITTISFDKPIADKIFNFVKTDFPGFEIIDLR